MPVQLKLLKLVSTCVLIYSTSVLLTGCNNDSNRNSGQPAANSDDVFVTQVRQQTDSADAMSDTTEPVDLMQINETAPEQTEPQEVSF